MGDKSGISWTEATWNPIVGCSIVSPGCTNCYAMQQAARITRMNPASHYEGTTKEVNGNYVWTGVLKQAPDHIATAPLRWKKPRLIFVNSMSDLFHESIPDEWIDRVMAVMTISQQHTFQVLTKRPQRMRSYLSAITKERIQKMAYELSHCVQYEGRWLFDLPLPNVWFGVSAEDQTRFNERQDDLINTPAAVRFVSYEPALGNIDICEAVGMWWNQTMNSWEGSHSRPINRDKWGGKKIDWIIYGGESGPDFRPDQVRWAEGMMEQCKAAGIAFYYKQDSGLRSGKQGRASAGLWAMKEFPQD